MKLNFMIRPCGTSYQYCDGRCVDCDINNLSYSTSTTAENSYITLSIVEAKKNEEY